MFILFLLHLFIYLCAYVCDSTHVEVRREDGGACALLLPCGSLHLLRARLGSESLYQLSCLNSSSLSAFGPLKGAASSSRSSEEQFILYTTLNYRANIGSFGILCVSLASSAFFLTQDSALPTVTGRPCWMSCSLTPRLLSDQDQKICKRTLFTN